MNTPLRISAWRCTACAACCQWCTLFLLPPQPFFPGGPCFLFKNIAAAANTHPSARAPRHRVPCRRARPETYLSYDICFKVLEYAHLGLATETPAAAVFIRKPFANGPSRATTLCLSRAAADRITAKPFIAARRNALSSWRPWRHRRGFRPRAGGWSGLRTAVLLSGR